MIDSVPQLGVHDRALERILVCLNSARSVTLRKLLTGVAAFQVFLGLGVLTLEQVHIGVADLKVADYAPLRAYGLIAAIGLSFRYLLHLTTDYRSLSLSAAEDDQLSAPSKDIRPERASDLVLKLALWVIVMLDSVGLVLLSCLAILVSAH